MQSRSCLRTRSSSIVWGRPSSPSRAADPSWIPGSQQSQWLVPTVQQVLQFDDSLGTTRNSADVFARNVANGQEWFARKLKNHSIFMYILESWKIYEDIRCLRYHRTCSSKAGTIFESVGEVDWCQSSSQDWSTAGRSGRISMHHLGWPWDPGKRKWKHVDYAGTHKKNMKSQLGCTMT